MNTNPTPVPAHESIENDRSEREKIIQRIEAMMDEASKISEAISTFYADHPAVFSMNRAWRFLDTSREQFKL